MRIVVTGGAGFVGSAIVRRLVGEGHRVRVVDDYSTGRPVNLEGVACDLHQVDAGEADYDQADAVVHAAAYPDVSANWKSRGERDRQWKSNADLTRRVLERVLYGRPFVLLSTCSVYGPGRVNEFSCPRATSPYAASKIAAEALVSAYTAAGAVFGRVLRLVNVVGPRYAHGHVADFVKQVKQTGRLHALDDGKKRKSFVHVDDVATAVLEAVTDARVNGCENPFLRNVTSEVQWSWRDTVAVMHAMPTGHPQLDSADFEVTCEPRASGWIGDPEELVVDTAYGYGKVSIVQGVREALGGLGW